MRRIDPRRLIFVDEAGAHLAMGRSHVWVRRGEEYVEARPMNWGDNLTLIGALRQEGWLTLRTKWRAVNTESFIQWVRRSLAPHLRPGDIVVLDNLKAHKNPVVRAIIERRQATVKLLPPYSHDFNPIEAAWALIKKHLRTVAPRTRVALRRAARAARYIVRPHHCRQYFAHAGYVNSSA
jgi:transposase